MIATFFFKVKLLIVIVSIMTNNRLLIIIINWLIRWISLSHMICLFVSHVATYLFIWIRR